MNNLLLSGYDETKQTCLRIDDRLIDRVWEFIMCDNDCEKFD